MELGAQLYTVRDYTQTEKDIETTLYKIAEIGYKSVQVSAIGKIKPSRLRQICDEDGLKIAITHTPSDEILFNTDEVIENHNILGCDFIGLGMIPKKYLDSQWIHHFALDFLGPAKKIADAGKKFMYHNHSCEFTRINGKLVMDIITEDIPPELMGITLDTYWLQASGCDVCSWIERLKDRIPCVHLKDMTIAKDGWAQLMAPVMEGNMNFKQILRKLEETKAVRYILVEQDTCQESPFICLKKSFDNLHSLGYK